MQVTSWIPSLILTLIALFALVPVTLGDWKATISLLCGVYLLHCCYHSKRRVISEMLVAFFFSFFITSYQEYIYIDNNILIGSINVFPLLAWTAALVALREVYDRLHIKYRGIIIILLYIFALFILEYVGYYFLGIRIQTEYPSLFGLGIIHGPPLIHIFYIGAGPLYLLVTNYLRDR